MATVSLSLYMWRRIREMGIQSVMGLPGTPKLAGQIDEELTWGQAIST